MVDFSLKRCGQRGEAAGAVAQALVHASNVGRTKNSKAAGPWRTDGFAFSQRVPSLGQQRAVCREWVVKQCGNLPQSRGSKSYAKCPQKNSQKFILRFLNGFGLR
jgi:hypothetical protein